LEVKVVGEQRRHGRRTDDHVRVDQVTSDVYRAVEHQLQRQADLTSGPVVKQHPARVGGQHDRLVRGRGSVRVTGLLVNNGHDGAPVTTLSQALETFDERQEWQLTYDVAPQQHEVVSDKRTCIQVPEHVAKRPTGVRSGIDDVQLPGAGSALYGGLDAVRASAGAEHDDVHDTRRLEHVQRVVEQRPVDEWHQARAVPVGNRPKVLVEETGHNHGLQHVLLLHLAGAHGGRRPGYTSCSGIPNEDVDGAVNVDERSELKVLQRKSSSSRVLFLLTFRRDTQLTTRQNYN